MSLVAPSHRGRSSVTSSGLKWSNAKPHVTARLHLEWRGLFGLLQQFIGQRAWGATLDLFGDRVRGSAAYVNPWLFRHIEDGRETAYALSGMNANLGVIADDKLVVSVFLHGASPLPPWLRCCQIVRPLDPGVLNGHENIRRIFAIESRRSLTSPRSHQIFGACPGNGPPPKLLRLMSVIGT